MESIEALTQYPPQKYFVQGHVAAGPGGTFVASAAFCSDDGERIPVTFLSGYPHNAERQARSEIEGFAQGYGYRLVWDV